MKLFLSIGFWLVLGFTGALAAESNLDPVQFAGKDYVRLTRWARINEFEVGWLKRDETLLLRRGANRIQVTVDSCEARINGVQVMLVAPVASHNGYLFVPLIDLEKTFPAILSPPRLPAGAAIRTICLDPGHGGKDPGFSVRAREEKKYTLLLAQEVRQVLLKAGFKVTTTRARDETLELTDRAEIAKRQKADLLISLHFNSAQAAAATVEGAEVYCLTPPGASSTNARGEGATNEKYPGNIQNHQNVFLAYQVQKAVTHGAPAQDRGVRRARFAVLRDATMPAVLLEGGYMSHPAEGRRIFDAAQRKRLARSIVEGIQAYQRAVQRAD